MNWWAYAFLAAGHDRLAAGVAGAVGDVVRHGVVEEGRLLDHHADLRAEGPDLDVADVVPVDPDRAALDVPEAGEQVHQGRLAASVGADQGDGLAVADLQFQALQDGVAAVVAEVDVLELDGRLVPVQADRLGLVGDLGAAVHQGADPVGGGRGPLDLGMDVGQLADRVGDPAEHRVERQQVLDLDRPRGELELEQAEVDRHRVVQDEIGPREEGNRYGRQRQGLEDRVGQGVDHRHSDALFVQALGLQEEPPAFVPLHRERLDDLDPLQALLEDLVDVGHALQRLSHGPLHDLARAMGAEPRDGDQHQGQAVSRQLSQSEPARQLAIRKGSRITRPMIVTSPCWTDSMSLVNRANSSAEP